MCNNDEDDIKLRLNYLSEDVEYFNDNVHEHDLNQITSSIWNDIEIIW